MLSRRKQERFVLRGCSRSRSQSSSFLKPNTRGRRAAAAERPQHGGVQAGAEAPQRPGQRRVHRTSGALDSRPVSYLEAASRGRCLSGVRCEEHVGARGSVGTSVRPRPRSDGAAPPSGVGVGDALRRRRASPPPTRGSCAVRRAGPGRGGAGGGGWPGRPRRLRRPGLALAARRPETPKARARADAAALRASPWAQTEI